MRKNERVELAAKHIRGASQTTHGRIGPAENSIRVIPAISRRKASNLLCERTQTRLGDDANGLQMEKVVPRFDKPWPPHFPNIPEFAEVNGTSASETLGPGLAWKGSHIHAGDGWDLVSAGSGQDTVWGDGGRDQIYGGDGNDTLYGGSEGDWLFGEANDDMIIGDDGDDAIVGGAGIDTLYGGLGADSFHWNNISETGVSAGFGGDKDVIGDFNPWQGDQNLPRDPRQ